LQGQSLGESQARVRQAETARADMHKAKPMTKRLRTEKHNASSVTSLEELPALPQLATTNN
jgi:hypothetical protein